LRQCEAATVASVLVQISLNLPFTSEHFAISLQSMENQTSQYWSAYDFKLDPNVVVHAANDEYDGGPPY
jgi:hypothetical protein